MFRSCNIMYTLGCELRRNKYVSDRKFGCYGKSMFRTVISDVSGTELIENFPKRGDCPKSQTANQRNKAYCRACGLALFNSTSTPLVRAHHH
jgi:hypothetical protein